MELTAEEIEKIKAALRHLTKLDEQLNDIKNDIDIVSKPQRQENAPEV